MGKIIPVCLCNAFPVNWNDLRPLVQLVNTFMKLNIISDGKPYVNLQAELITSVHTHTYTYTCTHTDTYTYTMYTDTQIHIYTTLICHQLGKRFISFVHLSKKSTFIFTVFLLSILYYIKLYMYTHTHTHTQTE